MLKEGTTRRCSATSATRPPSRPEKASVSIPISRAVCRPRTTLEDCPEVEIPRAMSFALPRSRICPAKTREKSLSCPIAVRVAVSVVSARAGSARRFSMMGCWNSTATCCASQADPPFPIAQRRPPSPKRRAISRTHASSRPASRSKSAAATRADSAALRRMLSLIRCSLSSALRREARGLEVPAVAVIRGAGAFGRDHGRPEGMLRRARLAEGGTVRRPLDALENETADADRRLLRLYVLHLEQPLGVVIVVFPPQAVPALGDHPDPAPLAVRDLEDLEDQAPGGGIPLAAQDAAVLVLDLMTPRLELAQDHQDPLEQIHGLEAGDHDGDSVCRRDGLVLRVAHHGADVAGAEVGLDAVLGRLQDRRDRGGHQDVRDQHREVR